MIRTRIAQATAVAAVFLTALLIAPAASAATAGTTPGSTAVTSDSLGWGG
ncbi:hypothetical protein [Streptomyces sp. CB01881]|nr:hypothetical protein [Streptomyces sp. CB01881]